MEPKHGRYSAEALETARRTWGEWSRGLGLTGDLHETATRAAVDYLELGLPAAAVASLVRLRLGRPATADSLTVREENAYLQRAIAEAGQMAATKVISEDVAETLKKEFRARALALDEWTNLFSGPAAHAQPQAAAVTAPAIAAASAAPATPIAPAQPAQPPPPPFSFRDLFAEHSVLMLAALGAFLLVVATVLFELYGTTGLGGGVRLGAVVALNLVFAVAGYFARRRKGLESVGQIYIALAAVLLPLVGVAAWTFLALGEQGITVYQAVAITAAACAAVYGTLARRLDLRAYGEMAGIAIFAAAVGASGWVLGDHWLAAGVALAPLAYAVWQRLLPARVFTHFQWFAHASALASLGLALRYAPTDWLWTGTLAALAFSYLAWQALAAQPLRAWIGEGAAILAAATASGPLGVSNGHFLLPMAVAIPLIALQREPEMLGIAGRLYRPHVAHLHAAVLAGLVLAAWENQLGEAWVLTAALWFAFVLYAADYFLGPTELTGYALRGVLPVALLLTGRDGNLGPWAGALTGLALVAYVIPFTRSGLIPLRRYASYFFYGALILVAVGLRRAEIGAGHWEIVAGLFISSVAFGVAAEMGAVRFSAIAARGLFTIAWFVGVDALNAQGWRGPFDALLALFYVGLGQARALARRRVANAARRFFVHATALVALGLCFTGPEDLLWWRLFAAFALLAVAYWWLALARKELELPWLAWLSVAGAAGSLSIAYVPDTWQGAVVAASAVILTGAWFAARPRLDRVGFETSAVVVLLLLDLIGTAMTFVYQLPGWPQAAACVLTGAFFLAWSLIGDAGPLLRWRPIERSAASLFASTGLLLAGGVLKVDAGIAGLMVLALASAHAEWSLRAKNDIERWYAMAAMLVAGPVFFFWPYAQEPAAIVAIEFVALAALTVQTAIRGRLWWLPYATVLLLGPALHFSFIALGRGSEYETEKVAFAVLAWLAGFAGLAIRTRFANRWAWSTEIAAVTLASGSLMALAVQNDADPIGIALLAYAPLIYTAGMQERERWVLPFAAASALAGSITLLYSTGADTILYAAMLGGLGLVFWGLGRAALMWLGRHQVIDMHRYLGLGLLAVSAIAGFNFPDRTGAGSLGAVLASVALLITGGVLWLDARDYGFRPNLYAAIVFACSAGFFVARYVGLDSWELVGPGAGFVAAGISLRREGAFKVDVWIRRLLVAAGLGLAMGWAVVLTVEGDVWWLVVLLIEGALTVGAGVALRSRVLLAGGGAALALASLRALLLIAQAGYLFVAFGAVALVLLIVATALALGRERYLSGTRGMREQLATWD